MYLEIYFRNLGMYLEFISVYKYLIENFKKSKYGL